jgi:hypothetical protein
MKMKVNQKIALLERSFQVKFWRLPSSYREVDELTKNLSPSQRSYWLERWQELAELYSLREHIEERGLGDLLS